MKRLLFWIYVVIFIVFLHISFVYVFNINRVLMPDFWLIIVFFVALYFEENMAFSVVFLLGMVKDIFEIGIFGMNAFLFLLVVFCFKMLLNRIYRENILNVLFFVFVFSTGYYFFKYVLYNIGGYKILFGTEYLFKALIVTIVAPFVFKLLLKQADWLCDNVAE